MTILALTFSLISLSTLYSAISSLFYLGKSRTMQKKLKARYSVLQRLLLHHVRDGGRDTKMPGRLRGFVWFLRIYAAAMVAWMVLALASWFGVVPKTAMEIISTVKIAALDLPISIYSMLMTGHRRPHLGWKWEHW